MTGSSGRARRPGSLCSRTGATEQIATAIGDRLSYPRRLWLRHSLRAAGWTLGLAVSLTAGAALAGRGERPGAVIGGSLGALCLAGAWRERRLARRTLVGARSEQVVRGALQALARQGWEVRHSVRWPDSRWGGDIDHVAVAPATGLAFAIETKARSYTFEHVLRTRACAERVGRRWRSPGGAHAVLCVTRGPSRCEVEHGVIVVSVDRLADALRSTDASGMPHAPKGPASILAAVGRWIGA